MRVIILASLGSVPHQHPTKELQIKSEKTNRQKQGDSIDLTGAGTGPIY